MKINIGFKFLTLIVLIYPLALGAVFLFGITPFPITAPFFFVMWLLLLAAILWKWKLPFTKSFLINFLLLSVLFLISLFNFSSIRYSLPILFTSYILLFYWYASLLRQFSYDAVRPMLNQMLIFYCALALFFLMLPHTNMAIGDRFLGFTGSPTTFAGILATLFLFLDAGKSRWSFERIILYAAVLVLVYLTKTRLVLLYMLAYPFLLVAMSRKRLLYRTLYLATFVILFSLYSIYGLVVENFPELITLRYEDGRDASFGLRYYLFELITSDFFSGNTWELLAGKGNEYSRLLVEADIGQDIYPHNDFYRLLTDWGLIGGGIFFIFLYRISGKNRTVLLISLLYLILFYSNLVFNLFIISVLILASFLPGSGYSESENKLSHE